MNFVKDIGGLKENSELQNSGKKSFEAQKQVEAEGTGQI